MEVSDTIFTLDRLFRTTRPVTIAGRALVVRALSSIDVRNRFDEGTLATVAARREMKDPLSRRYRLIVASVLEQIDDDELRRLLVTAEHNRAMIEAVRKILPELTPIPDEASEDERAGVLVARAADIERANALRDKFVAAREAAREKEVATLERAEMEAQYKAAATAIAIENAFGNAYEDAGLVYSVRHPDGSAYFADLDEARACPEDVRAILLREMGLVNDLDPLRLSGPSSTEPPLAAGS